MEIVRYLFNCTKRRKVPTTTSPEGVEVVPITTSPEGAEVVPIATSPEDVEVVPTTTSPEGVEVVPTTTSPEEVEVVPTTTSPEEVEVVPTTTSPEEVEVVPTTTSPEEVEVVPTTTSPEGVEVIRIAKSPAEARAIVESIIATNAVVVFSKTYCPYCEQTKDRLTSLGAKFEVIELDKRDDLRLLQDALYKLTGQATVPNTFIKEKKIGGNDALQAQYREGDLEVKLRAAGAISGDGTRATKGDNEESRM
ncbi:thioredoxin-like protein [Kalaharituber pfeilii]|nr:thioredoxin-like protein [Kalaharituber pfeilii]